MSEGSSPMEKLKGIFHKSGKLDSEKEAVPSIFFVEFSKLPSRDREKSLRSMIGKDVQFIIDSRYVDGLLFEDDTFLMDGETYFNITFGSLLHIKSHDERKEEDIQGSVDVLFTQEQFQDLNKTYWGLSDPIFNEMRNTIHNLRIPICSILDLRIIKVSKGPKRLRGKPSFLFKGVILPIEAVQRSPEEKLYGISRVKPSGGNVGYAKLDDLGIFVQAEKKRSKIPRR